VWLALIVLGGAGFSLFFACATPFAALATLAALNMDRRDGAAAVVLAWLANQAIGYGMLGYPWTWDSFAWGGAIGLAALLGYVAARALSSDQPVRLAVSLPFVAAFAAYEIALYMAGFALGTEPSAFAFAVVRQILEVNIVALIGLWAVSQLLPVMRLGANRTVPHQLASSVS
jgi:hypothetical protein